MNVIRIFEYTILDFIGVPKRRQTPWVTPDIYFLQWVKTQWWRNDAVIRERMKKGRWILTLQAALFRNLFLIRRSMKRSARISSEHFWRTSPRRSWKTLRISKRFRSRNPNLRRRTIYPPSPSQSLSPLELYSLLFFHYQSFFLFIIFSVLKRFWAQWEFSAASVKAARRSKPLQDSGKRYWLLLLPTANHSNEEEMEKKKVWSVWMGKILFARVPSRALERRTQETMPHIRRTHWY